MDKETLLIASIFVGLSTCLIAPSFQGRVSNWLESKSNNAPLEKSLPSEGNELSEAYRLKDKAGNYKPSSEHITIWSTVQESSISVSYKISDKTGTDTPAKHDEDSLGRSQQQILAEITQIMKEELEAKPD